MLIELYIKYKYAKFYGDSIFPARKMSAQSLHVEKVRILLIRDIE